MATAVGERGRIRRASASRGGAGRRGRPSRAPCAVGRPIEAATASSAFASVFRRRVNTACDQRARTRVAVADRRLGRRESAGGRRADWTFGGGRNAPGGSVSTRSTSARWPIRTRQHAVVAACRARPPAGRRPPAAASASRRRAARPSSCSVEQLEQDRRGDVVGQVAGDANGRSALARREQLGDREIDARGNRPRRPCTFGGARVAKRGREIAIDLDGDDRAGARGQRARQRAAARADLEERLVRLRVRSPRSPCATQAGSRKCWPKRLRAAHATRPARRSVVSVVAAPVALLDLLDLFLAQAEVVADLVNQRLADRRRRDRPRRRIRARAVPERAGCGRAARCRSPSARSVSGVP